MQYAQDRGRVVRNLLFFRSNTIRPHLARRSSIPPPAMSLKELVP